MSSTEIINECYTCHVLFTYKSNWAQCADCTTDRREKAAKVEEMREQLASVKEDLIVFKRHYHQSEEKAELLLEQLRETVKEQDALDLWSSKILEWESDRSREVRAKARAEESRAARMSAIEISQFD